MELLMKYKHACSEYYVKFALSAKPALVQVRWNVSVGVLRVAYRRKYFDTI